MEQRKTISFFIAFIALFWTAMTGGRTYASAETGKNGKFTLVIDAGHGGKDPGAIGRFSREKNINLSVAKAFGQLVEKNCPDVEVIYTRKTDVFVPLARRAEIANQSQADLFVSIHTNAMPGRAVARGAETYTLGMARADENLEVAKRENSVILVEEDYKERYEGFDPTSAESYIIFELMQDQYMAQSVDFARLIQKEFRTTGGRADKGVHQAGFLVLRETSMPSVLVELGYISTHDEEAFLNSQNGIRKMSQSIYNAFRAYKRLHGNGTATSTPSRDEADEAGKQPTESAAESSIATSAAIKSAWRKNICPCAAAAVKSQHRESYRAGKQKLARARKRIIPYAYIYPCLIWRATRSCIKTPLHRL